MKILSEIEKTLFEKLVNDRKPIAKSLNSFAASEIKKVISDKYSEKAHFVYELIQNADDAEASNVRMILEEDGFYFSHDGKRHFSITDVDSEKDDYGHNKLGDINSITAVGKSTKLEEGVESKIGKFGIGFKAVYQYTDTPHIFDPPFNFKIEDFFVPILLDEKNDNTFDNETLFFFPFNKSDKAPVVANQEIHNLIIKLNNPLLFLSNLKSIYWIDKTTLNSGCYKNEIVQKDNYKLISLISEIDNTTNKETFMVFEKIVDEINDVVEHIKQQGHKINIAFKIDNKEIYSETKYPAYCFFPTKEYTGLRFIVQAPFLLTNNREKIKSDETWNINLIQEIANLTSESINIFKKENLLGINIYDVFPIVKSDFTNGNQFITVYEKVLEKFKSSEKLLPSNDGDFISAEEALMGRGKDFIELFDSDTLYSLFNKKYFWILNSITENSVLGKYLINDIGIEYRNPRDFGKYLKDNKQFFEDKTDDWLIKLYIFLSDKLYLWQKYSYQTPEYRDIPLIRLEDNHHTNPFDENGKPKVFLSNDSHESLQIVKRSLISNETSYKFLKDLGLKNPEIGDEIIQVFTSKYKSHNEISFEESIKDLQILCDKIQHCTSFKRDEIIVKLKSMKFLIGNNFSNTLTSYFKPSELYLTEEYSQNKDVGVYFEGNNDVYYLDSIYSKNIKNFEILLGLLDFKREIRTIKKDVDTYGYVYYRNELINGKYYKYLRGLNGYDYKFSIEGLEFAINNINFDKSKIIWNLLVKNYRNICGVIELSNNINFPREKTELVKNNYFNQTIIECAWIPDKEGNFCKPGELSMNQLISSFNVEEPLQKEVAKKLLIKENIKENILNALPLELRKRFEFANTLTDDEIDVLIDYREKKYSIVQKPIPDIKRRLEKAVYNYNIAPEKIVNKKERSVRISIDKATTRTNLRNWYSSMNDKVICQICSKTSSFVNTKNEPYFEAVELLENKKEIVDNALALCPECAAKYLYGKRTDNDEILENLEVLCNTAINEEMEEYILQFNLCDNEVIITFQREHLIMLSVIFDIEK